MIIYDQIAKQLIMITMIMQYYHYLLVILIIIIRTISDISDISIYSIVNVVSMFSIQCCCDSNAIVVPLISWICCWWWCWCLFAIMLTIIMLPLKFICFDAAQSMRPLPSGNRTECPWWSFDAAVGDSLPLQFLNRLRLFIFSCFSFMRWLPWFHGFVGKWKILCIFMNINLYHWVNNNHIIVIVNTINSTCVIF